MGAEKTRAGFPVGVRSGDMAHVYRNLLCPAKLNLVLRVGRKKANGFHDIESLMTTVNWGDRMSIKLKRAKLSTIFIKCPELDSIGESNLVCRAFKLFIKHFRETLECEVQLKKVIPTGAGLGGGSSDAAMMLRILARFCKLSKSDYKKLIGYAAELGSDVPFFMSQGVAWCTGRGEKLTEISVRAQHVVIVCPPVHSSTPIAYKALDDQRGLVVPSFKGMPDSWKFHDLDVPELINDFEETVLILYPKLRFYQRALIESGAQAVRMSGSGASFFGVFESGHEAKKAALALEAKGIRAISALTGPVNTFKA